MRMRVGRSRDREGGAALVEFAVLAPLLLLLVLGIVEFGWLFGQFNDVRHGAREGARFAAVNGDIGSFGGSGVSDAADIRTYVCQAMDGISAGISVLEVGFNLDPDGDGTVSNRGDLVEITVRATIDSLTGAPLIAAFLPDDLSSTIQFRMERSPSSWISSDPSILQVTC